METLFKALHANSGRILPKTVTVAMRHSNPGMGFALSFGSDLQANPDTSEAAENS